MNSAKRAPAVRGFAADTADDGDDHISSCNDATNADSSGI